MLSPEALEAWCNGIGVPSHSRALIDRIRASDPARRVGGGRSNVSGRYPSRKMGVTIQFESHRVELAGIYEMEHDAEVLEFYDQPIQIKLDYEAAGGKRLGVLHTPDFFVIRRTAAGWEEWKTEEELLRLAERSPKRYRAAEGGQWHCPPGEACAQRFWFLLSRPLFPGDRLGVPAEYSVPGGLRPVRLASPARSAGAGARDSLRQLRNPAERSLSGNRGRRGA